jgi:hypothetical protein
MKTFLCCRLSIIIRCLPAATWKWRPKKACPRGRSNCRMTRPTSTYGWMNINAREGWWWSNYSKRASFNLYISPVCWAEKPCFGRVSSVAQDIAKIKLISKKNHLVIFHKSSSPPCLRNGQLSHEARKHAFFVSVLLHPTPTRVDGVALTSLGEDLRPFRLSFYWAAHSSLPTSIPSHETLA